MLWAVLPRVYSVAHPQFVKDANDSGYKGLSKLQNN